MGLLSELMVAVPWGHIAAKAWGSLGGPPVLCLHGWLDNANSFDKLIPLLPQDFHYVAMDFGGHGLSSHHSPGFLYHFQDYVNEVLRVVQALKWNRFSLLGHSFGGAVGGMFACVFPEMVDKLILLDSMPFFLDYDKVEHLLTYKRRAIEHVMQLEASQKPSQVVSREEMLQRFLKNNISVGEECGKLLLQRGTTQVATGLVLNRDRRITWPEHCVDFVSREFFVHTIGKLQARMLLIKSQQGYYSMKPGAKSYSESMLFMIETMKSILRERFQYVEVSGNHYVHMNAAHLVAPIVSAFLRSQESPGS